jgi:multiple sugar transport system ATP-binding protein
VVLPLPATRADLTGRTLVYGIRPEHLALDPQGIAAAVKLVEPMGSETQVSMTIAGTTVIGVFRERVRALPGEVIRVRPETANVHIFDAASGRRL